MDDPQSQGAGEIASHSPAATPTPSALPGGESPPAWLRQFVESVVGELGAKAAAPSPFVEFPELLRLVPLGERTVRDAMRRGFIPHIRLPGARRILFDPEAVKASLRRFEQGGAR